MLTRPGPLGPDVAALRKQRMGANIMLLVRDSGRYRKPARDGAVTFLVNEKLHGHPGKDARRERQAEQTGGSLLGNTITAICDQTRSRGMHVIATRAGGPRLLH